MTPPRTRHLVWDWNGTLLDDVQACVDAINCMIQPRGLQDLTVERYREVFRFPVKSYYDELGFDLAHEDWDELAREFHRHYARTSPAAGLREGVSELLDELRGAFPMSILSASEHTILARMLDGFRIRAAFTHVRGLKDLYAASKLALGHALREELREAPEAILLVGDTTHDFEVASELGWRCALLTGGHQSESRLRTCPCPVLHGVDALREFLQTA